MNAPRHPAAVAALTPLSWLYGGAMRMRNRYYDGAGRARRATLPVISVGNITAGGTGKTPTVAWIARTLARDGVRPAVVSRGYGGTAGKGPLVVSDGSGARCGADHAGDEPVLLAGMLPGVPVIVGSDRVAGVRAARETGGTVALLDDGFQHRRLARDLDIVLLDASNPFGNYRLLPAGLLREPVDGLARADVVLITRAGPRDSFTVIERVVRQYNRRAPILRAGHRPVGYRDLGGADVPTPARAVAFCGIGNPNRFRMDLEADGVEVVTFHARPDHHRYAAEELATLGREAASARGVLITTEKDLARMTPALAGAAGVPLLTFRIEAEVFDAEPLVDLLRLACAPVAA